jgi:hypothetical protein
MPIVLFLKADEKYRREGGNANRVKAPEEPRKK